MQNIPLSAAFNLKTMDSPYIVDMVEFIEALIKKYEQNLSGTLNLIDVARFSMINHRHGYQIGTKVLEILEERIMEFTGEHGSICRFYKDQWFIFYPSILTSEQAKHHYMLITHHVCKTIQIPELEDSIKPIIRVITSPFGKASNTPETVLAACEQGLKKAKNENMLFLYESNYNSPFYINKTKMLADFINETKLGRVELHLQPKVDLGTFEITGVEALLRWRKKNGGYWPTDKVIAAATQLDVIQTLGKWCIYEVFKMAEAYYVKGVPLKIAFNLSPYQLHSVDVIATLKKLSILKPHIVNLIEIEVTEDALFASDEITRDHIEQLSQMGISIVIDDYGIGYSNISKVMELPCIDAIKIDKSLISMVGVNAPYKYEQAIRSIVALAGAIQAVVVGEGVESEVQLEVLKRTGVHSAQGYLFSRPISRAQFDKQFCIKRKLPPSIIKESTDTASTNKTI